MNETSPDSEYRMRELRVSLERRIEGLERRRGGQALVHWLGPLLGAAGLVVALNVSHRTSDALRMGVVAPSIEAGSFVLKDTEGLAHATLGIGKDGGTALTLSDASGRKRLRLSVLADGSPGVSLMDSSGETRAILGLLPDGTTSLVFADRGSVARGVFALTPDGSARVIFSDPNGVTRAAVGVDSSGDPEINTIDASADHGGGGG